ncbi:MAG: DUF6502 family protein [Gammaproteobacteria bacterium]|nr:DUF6502 family protein [Gammaproteobacteria bacterium]
MSTIRETLNNALSKILTALIRTMLRNGMSYGEFDQIARKCFVDVAFRNFTPGGKKQTVSNVAILTGLNRKEVKKLNELDASQTKTGSKQYNRSIRVIGGWINDPDYLRADGSTRDLDMEGSHSFTSLVKKYSGDMPVAAMQKALTESGNISVDGNAKVRLLSHAYLPSDDPAEKLTILGTDTQQLIETINHNITASTQNLHFQRKASNPRIPVDAIPKIKQFTQRKGQAFLEEVDLYLSQHESEDENEEAVELSVSLFYHESTPADQESS